MCEITPFGIYCKPCCCSDLIDVTGIAATESDLPKKTKDDFHITVSSPVHQNLGNTKQDSRKNEETETYYDASDSIASYNGIVFEDALDNLSPDTEEAASVEQKHQQSKNQPLTPELFIDEVSAHLKIDTSSFTEPKEKLRVIVTQENLSLEDFNKAVLQILEKNGLCDSLKRFKTKIEEREALRTRSKYFNNVKVIDQQYTIYNSFRETLSPDERQTIFKPSNPAKETSQKSSKRSSHRYTYASDRSSSYQRRRPFGFQYRSRFSDTPPKRNHNNRSNPWDFQGPRNESYRSRRATEEPCPGYSYSSFEGSVPKAPKSTNQPHYNVKFPDEINGWLRANADSDESFQQISDRCVTFTNPQGDVKKVVIKRADERFILMDVKYVVEMMGDFYVRPETTVQQLKNPWMFPSWKDGIQYEAGESPYTYDISKAWKDLGITNAEDKTKSKAKKVFLSCHPDKVDPSKKAEAEEEFKLKHAAYKLLEQKVFNKDN
ncbi:J domain-containing protein [Endozoicomonas sp. Mp262]|uniref:J domain-containing protein n=1 Tax=Endozoicomonas sp. Mp262 TaxID=2919499 RepID=UPI0021D9131D